MFNKAPERDGSPMISNRPGNQRGAANIGIGDRR